MSINIDKLSIRDNPEGSQEKRLEQLRPQNSRSRHSGPLYSRIVRFLRLALPLIAVGIVGILFAWPSIEKTAEPIAKQSLISQTIGKNELVRPRFESEDSKKQPFTITAKRAVQSSNDPEIIFLEEPAADITLSSGAWIAVQARRGAYRQHDEKLLLENDVKLFHDAGYQMETKKLMMNLKNRTAWSRTPVYGQGPAGTLNAANGLTAETETEILVFHGPVKLVLNRKIKGL